MILQKKKKETGAIKRLNNVFTDNSENQDNFELLINDKEKIKNGSSSFLQAL